MEHIQEGDRSKWTAHSNHTIKCFTKGDIDRMTNSYRTRLGSGAFGEVYEGVLEDGSKVAVKMFIHNVKENFAKELIVHREINHKNVVRLIGCCEEENALMLVTEYIANGNLSDFLHNDNCPIPLDVRLRIAIECAEVLAYMHSHMYTQVIHGDIKPGNILLDSNFHAKLSDFGISRLANTDNTLHTNNVIGSVGYMDPLFAWDGLITVKYDVYSFGVVLLELITRKKATLLIGNVNIVYAFTSALARGIRGARGMFDAEIASNDNIKIVEGIAKVASECLTMERERRPEMTDVVERLRVLQKASHQDQGRQQVDMFSWARKNKPATPASANIPASILASDVCHQFSFADIKSATNNFDESLHIRDGEFRRVYRGTIYGAGAKVLVKLCYQRSDREFNMFYDFIVMMSKQRHLPLVPLIGYCVEKQIILVYDYMDRGSLFKNLRTQKPPLTCKQRIEICIAAARGLVYLHELQIIHGDVKTEKILLDDKWVAKINFSPSNTRPSPEITMISGTLGYLDPEYMATCRITEKSDVYSFGVVLFEVLCAQLAFDYKLPEGQQCLSKRALQCKKEGNLDQIIDPYLMGRINPWCLDKIAETAEKCVAERGIDRPSMADVVSDLEYALQLQVGAEAS
ncbi:unnamed protein product [Urochloa humidicola]